MQLLLHARHGAAGATCQWRLLLLPVLLEHTIPWILLLLLLLHLQLLLPVLLKQIIAALLLLPQKRRRTGKLALAISICGSCQLLLPLLLLLLHTSLLGLALAQAQLLLPPLLRLPF
jgi:hypothetical protein